MILTIIILFDNKKNKMYLYNILYHDL